MIKNKSIQGMLRDLVDNSVYIVTNAGAPTSGTSGTGVGICGPGTLLLDTTNKTIYRNTNTKASPTWTLTTLVDGLTVASGALTSPSVTTGLGTVMGIEATFTETTGAGVYTGSVAVPAGATILDVVINAVALWNTTTSATLKVGDAADDDGYYTGVDLKATDLLAGESISFALAGGKAGAYIANSQVSPRYSASARVVSGIITTVGAAGSAGRTRMTVYYSLPVTADIVAATKV